MLNRSYTKSEEVSTQYVVYSFAFKMLEGFLFFEIIHML